MKNKIIAVVAILVLVLTALWLLFQEQLTSKVLEKAFSPDRQTPKTEETQPQNLISGSLELVYENIQTPWEIIFLPDGDMLVTERSGTLKRFGKNPASIPIENVRAVGESGLLGLALHPNFENNNFLYLYKTVADGSNQVERYKFINNTLSDKKVIIQNIPGASNHDGGRIAFGPDGKLYITTGDAQNESLAQDTNSLAGKILRINDDGTIPNDNPFNNPVYSAGHRNPQGLTWDDQGKLWSTEHGRSGIRSGFDEVNLIEKSANYGWPNIEGDSTRHGMWTPAAHSGATTTWAPADIIALGKKLYFTGLRGQSLYSADINGDKLGQITAQFTSEYGRLRAISYHDGYLYFGTSNTDGRGTLRANDDKIYRIRME